jgi:hypothetical protein
MGVSKEPGDNAEEHRGRRDICQTGSFPDDPDDPAGSILGFPAQETLYFF